MCERFLQPKRFYFVFFLVYLLSSSFEYFQKRRDLVYTVSPLVFGPFLRIVDLFDPDAWCLIFSSGFSSLACQNFGQWSFLFLVVPSLGFRIFLAFLFRSKSGFNCNSFKTKEYAGSFGFFLVAVGCHSWFTGLFKVNDFETFFLFEISLGFFVSGPLSAYLET